MRVTLAPAAASHLDWIAALEADARSGGYVNGDAPAKHAVQFADPACRYLIVRDGARDAGFALLRGVGTSAIELKRIVIAAPGAGLGRAALRAVMDYAFGELRAHRLCLDVFEDNARAQHVYRSLGFVHDGRQRDVAKRDGRFVSLDLYAILDHEYALLNGDKP